MLIKLKWHCSYDFSLNLCHQGPGKAYENMGEIQTLDKKLKYFEKY